MCLGVYQTSLHVHESIRQFAHIFCYYTAPSKKAKCARTPIQVFGSTGGAVLGSGRPDPCEQCEKPGRGSIRTFVNNRLPIGRTRLFLIASTSLIRLCMTLSLDDGQCPGSNNTDLLLSIITSLLPCCTDSEPGCSPLNRVTPMSLHGISFCNVPRLSLPKFLYCSKIQQHMFLPYSNILLFTALYLQVASAITAFIPHAHILPFEPSLHNIAPSLYIYPPQYLSSPTKP